MMESMQPLITSDELLNLIQHLKDLGFAIDLKQYLSGHQAIEMLNVLFCENQIHSIDTIRNSLAPVFCITPVEQERFYEFFPQWLQTHPRIIQTFHTVQRRLSASRRSRKKFVVKHKINKSKSYSIVSRLSRLRVVLFWGFGIAILFGVSIAVFIGFSYFHARTNKPAIQSDVFSMQVIGKPDLKPIDHAKVTFGDTYVFTDGKGFFSIPRNASGQITITHRNYLSGKISVSSPSPLPLPSSTMTSTSSFVSASLWKKISSSLNVVVRVTNRQGTPLPNADITFSGKSMQSNPRGIAILPYFQKDTLSAISVFVPGYARDTILVPLHGYYSDTVRFALESDKSVTSVQMAFISEKINDFADKVLNQHKFTNEFDRLVIEYFSKVMQGLVYLFLCLLVLWFLVQYISRQLFLQRIHTQIKPSAYTITVASVSQQLLKNALFRNVVVKFRQHQKTGNYYLDVKATVIESVRTMGFFSPVYAKQMQLPEYVALIDRSSFQDQHSHIIDEIISRMMYDGVAIDRYFFDSDPRLCWSAHDEHTNPKKIQELSARFPNHHVLIFSTASGFFNDITGQTFDWVQTLFPWESKHVFIPENSSNMRYFFEHLQNKGFTVNILSLQGMCQQIMNFLEEKRVNLRKTDDSLYDSTYPSLVEEKHAYCLQQCAPKETFITKLFKQLELYLHEEGMLWLAACAVYPRLQWELTYYLIVNLYNPEHKTLTEKQQLDLLQQFLRMTRLPWFRHGTMPEWFRLRVVSRLDLHQYREVKKILLSLFSPNKNETRGLDEIPASSFKLSFGYFTVAQNFERIRRYVRARLLKETDLDSIENDHIFAQYMSYKPLQKLVFLIPKNIRHLFYTQGTLSFGIKPIVPLILTLFLCLGVWFGFEFLKPAQHIAPPIPTFYAVGDSILYSNQPLKEYVTQFAKYKKRNSIPKDQYMQWLVDTLIIQHKFDTAQYTVTSSSIDIPISITSFSNTVPMTASIPEMVFVQGGFFFMGSELSPEELVITFGGVVPSYDDEFPRHRVSVSDFYIGKYEITQKEYFSVMGVNPSGFKGDMLPVETVNWFDAVLFCNELSKKKGFDTVYTYLVRKGQPGNGCSLENIRIQYNKNGYRLPTESEWEFAARGGNKAKGFLFSGSMSVDSVAWYNENSNKTTRPIGQKNPNELNLFDMSGNVGEWCNTWFGRYSAEGHDTVTPSTSEKYRAIRGGGYSFAKRDIRCAQRFRFAPDERATSLGFRCARSQEK